MRRMRCEYSFSRPSGSATVGRVNLFFVFNQDDFKIKRFFHFITQFISETVHTGARVMYVDEMLIYPVVRNLVIVHCCNYTSETVLERPSSYSA